MATVRELYDTDFTGDLNVGSVFQLRVDGVEVNVPVRLHFDFTSYAKYVSCYLETAACRGDVCKGLVGLIDRFLALGDSVEVSSGFGSEPMVNGVSLVFTGRFFVYHEAGIDDPAIRDAEAFGTAHRVAVRFRGPMYAAEKTALERPLAFISHDSRDQDAIARPLAIELVGLRCPVWFDEFSLNVGDRLRESIERGIQEARKCVLVLTPNFLSNTGWTRAEFDAVFTREMVERADVVLPVWSDVTAAQVYEYSPTLANRVAVQWTLGSKEVARRLHRAILRSS